MTPAWDYLIVTAANEWQGQAYEAELSSRRGLGMVAGARHCRVVVDEGGRRIGSGGSTIQCLSSVLRHEGTLDALRILIVHAGGDSRRAPAYSPCGKIFTPLPGDAAGPLPLTLFDRLVPTFLDLPRPLGSAGQVVVAAGDALLLFDPHAVRFAASGITVLATGADPEEASRHGVYCLNRDNSVRLYLQKPPVPEQRALGATNEHGKTLLDIGIMSLDGSTAAHLVELFARPRMHDAILEFGLDLYREICCALGTGATPQHYLRTAAASGSRWPEQYLLPLFSELHPIAMEAALLDECRFLHFGSTRQLIESGLELVAHDTGVWNKAPMIINSHVGATLDCSESWVEGCDLRAPVTLGGRNVVVGVDAIEPLQLPAGASLDITPGRDRSGQSVSFVRCYGTADTFKQPVDSGATFCGRLLAEWLASVRAEPEAIWPDLPGGERRTLWNARVFPADPDPLAYRKWLWMFDIENARDADFIRFHEADRYSSADVALLASLPEFRSRRAELFTGRPKPPR